jgi:phosphinothricin acetyltransferase
MLIQNNEGSIKLLEKFGFERWGCMPEIVEFKGDKFDHLYYGLHI